MFFNSLHHVPIEHQARALQEAARALRPGGLLCAIEPFAEGPHFEANAEPRDGKFTLDQPIRLNLSVRA